MYESMFTDTHGKPRTKKKGGEREREIKKMPSISGTAQEIGNLNFLVTYFYILSQYDSEDYLGTSDLRPKGPYKKRGHT